MAGTSYSNGTFSDPQVLRGGDTTKVEPLNLPRVEDLKRTDALPGGFEFAHYLDHRSLGRFHG